MNSADFQIEDYLAAILDDSDDVDGKVNYFAADPITWSWLALKVSEGIVKGLGAQVIKDLLGRGTDVAKLLEKFLREMAAVVRRAIAEDALRSATASMQGAQNLYLDYLENGNVDLIDNVQAAAEDSVQQIASLKFIGHHAFLNAASVQMAILQGLYPDDEGMKRRIADRAQFAVSHVQPFAAAWQSWHWSRYDIKVKEITTPVLDGVRVDVYESVMRDGQAVYTLHNKPRGRIQTALAQIRQSDWDNETFPKFVQPSNIIVEEWKKLI